MQNEIITHRDGDSALIKHSQVDNDRLALVLLWTDR